MIYALKNTETGIANNWSKEEVNFQNFYKFKHPSVHKEASHLTGRGGRMFNKKKLDLYNTQQKL